MRSTVTVLALIGLMSVSACKPPAPATQSTAPAPAPPAASSATNPLVSSTKLYQPEYTLAIDSSGEPKHTIIRWSARVNTGGWTMRTEDVKVEAPLDVKEARIYVILTQPAPGDMVTQSLETLEGSYDAGEVKIAKAELSVKQVVAGEGPSIARLYAVVKRAP